MKRKLSFIVLIVEIIAISLLHALKMNHPDADNHEFSAQANSLPSKFPSKQFVTFTQISTQLGK